MQQVIAGTYEIVREIGAGGAGVVYLARHLRLNKDVVLKADRRTLSSRPETLRREVDALKNLSHTYIPQVYDFLVEDGVVYTVMDYIPGESLDKPLARGERFSQAQVIQWAFQLLEALCYLHSRAPHGILHGDIKPANIMLTPQNTICLIDFNIALALGEKGAVRVGFSRGYASPEHYGVDYAGTAATQGVGTSATTVVEETPETVLADSAWHGVSSGADGHKTILLDVRSDIYSLGATLYHLFTGVRPAQDAREVVPMSAKEFSPGVAAIIWKAMAPNPNDRFQSAAEMLQAFDSLYSEDSRTKRHRRRKLAAAGILTALFLAGGCSAFVGLRQMEQRQNAYALAEYSASALRAGDVEGAVAYALEALPAERTIWDAPYTAQAQKALTDALGVYDLSDGYHAMGTLRLPSEPLKLLLSPEGGRLASLYAYEVAVYDLETGRQLAVLEAEPSALSDVRFLDEDRLLYAGAGALRAYDLTAGQELWAGGPATSVVVSADGSRAAAVYRSEHQAVLYDTETGAVVQTVSFGDRSQHVAINDSFADPEDDLLALNRDGTKLAASFSDGTLAVYDLEDPSRDLELLDPHLYAQFDGGFSGAYFAFSAYGEGGSLFAVVDTAQLAQTGGFAGQSPFLVQADESGIAVALEDVLVLLDPVTGEQTEVAYTQGDPIRAFSRGEAYTMVATEGQACWFFRGAEAISHFSSQESCDFIGAAGDYAVVGSRNTPAVQLQRLESRQETQVLAYDAAYAHDEARVSADGSTVMLFRYDGFRLYHRDGRLLAEVALPDPEQVYDQQYRREAEASWLEVLYYDGTMRRYSAADGALLSEERLAPPDPSLYEEFYTDTLRITAPLHGTPVAYDRETGEEIAALEEDDYLTYVTQVGMWVMTEYITAQGERYGLLLNERCETLAYLPNLCDIVGDTLYFDYLGTLRTSRVYSLRELIALGESEIGGRVQ